MNKNKYLSLFLATLSATLLVSGPARADRFDDAVTEYLKGFEYCKEAKSHLSANRIGAAQQAMAQYNKLLASATRTDNSILSTSKRGMDGNLKFCTRVARDVEVEAGMPVMDKALAACDAAQQALKDDKPDQARSELAAFRSLKDQALTLAPSLNDIFTVKNQISRCERIDSKIASSSKKQEALKLSLETAQEESIAYVTSCQKTLETLNREKMLDDPVLRDANQGLGSARSHRKNALDEKLANQTFKDNANHPVKLALDANLKKGDQCVASLNQTISRKTQELTDVKTRFAEHVQQLNAAGAQCSSAQQNARGTATQDRYAAAKTEYEKALQQRNDIRDALARNAHYRTYESWDNVRGIEQQMQTLNQCLDDTRRQMEAMFVALSATPAAVATTTAPTPAAAASTPVTTRAITPAAAPATTDSATIDSATTPAPVATAPAQPAAKSTAADGGPARFNGTLRMNGLVPEFVLFYVADGTEPATTDITIERTGFDSLLYVARSGASLTFKNKDNTTHRVIASNESLKLVDNLTRLQPRQSKQAQVSWPANSIATLRSDRGALAASYIANVPSANYLKISFKSGNETTFTFKNDKAINTAWLIMPDTDPLSFTLTRGETKSLAITRNHVPIGSLLVTGE